MGNFYFIVFLDCFVFCFFFGIGEMYTVFSCCIRIFLRVDVVTIPPSGKSRKKREKEIERRKEKSVLV